jgi:hypothetical protein
MDEATFLDDLRDAHETPLSRLGSSKSLYALTGGEMDAGPVRAAAAADAAAAAETVAAWADDEPDEAAADLFERAAAESREVVDTVAGDVDPADGDASPIYDRMAELEGTPARVGGLVGRGLVAGKVTEQMVGFFVGDADPMTANTFREVRSTVEAQRDDAAALLASVCADADDWAAAEEAATAVVETAYDHYVETLESMGVKPKNVC